MPAFVLVEITIHDPQLYEAYKLLTPPSIAAYGGRFVVRGGAAESLEGDWHPQRLVMVQFPNMAQAKAWWHSPAYTEARAIRQRAATTRMLVVEGVEE